MSAKIDPAETTEEPFTGHARLWGWFGLSRASFLTLPRVMMHAMPDEWQGRMAALLEEYDAAFPNQPDIGTTVRATRGGKIVPMPDVFTNYRRPDLGIIDSMRQP
jgi:hypothetical protein